MDIPAIEWPFGPSRGQGGRNLPYAQRVEVISACARLAYIHLQVLEHCHAS